MSKKQELAAVDLQADMPKPLQQYLQKTLGQIDSVASDPDSLWQAGQRGLQMEAAGKILAGKAFSLLREQLPSREFATGLADCGIPRRTAYDAIEAYELFSALPNFNSVCALGLLGITKARALSHWPADDHAAFAAGKTVRGLSLVEAAELSSRDITQQQREWALQNESATRKLREELANTKTQLETARNENLRLMRSGPHVLADEDLPQFALIARQESLAMTEQMSFCLDTLQAVIEQQLLVPAKKHDDERFRPVAAGTAYFALAGIQARAQQLLKRLQVEFGEVGEVLTTEQQLSKAEIKRFLENRERLLAQHKADAQARDDDRENNRPGKRGAKRKGGR